MTRDHSEAAGAPATAYDAPSPAHPADPAYDVRDFMVRAWSELLGRSDLTEHSDFFVRGGDSLLISRLVRRIGQEFDVTVSLYDMSRRNLGDQVALVHRARAGECREGAAGYRPTARCEGGHEPFLRRPADRTRGTDVAARRPTCGAPRP